MRISDWSSDVCSSDLDAGICRAAVCVRSLQPVPVWRGIAALPDHDAARKADLRSEEHTSERQSLMRIPSAVFCLKKKINCTNLLDTLQLHKYVRSCQAKSLSCSSVRIHIVV